MSKYEDLLCRVWDGEKMRENVSPWKWDFVIDWSYSKCIRSTGPGPLGSGGKEADFEVPGIAFKEIMRYSGRKDKNEKKIYEGDIIRVTNRAGKNGVHLVYWNEVELNLSLIFVRGFMSGWKEPSLYLTNTLSCIVLGNQYENPELLEEYKNKYR